MTTQSIYLYSSDFPITRNTKSNQLLDEAIARGYIALGGMATIVNLKDNSTAHHLLINNHGQCNLLSYDGQHYSLAATDNPVPIDAIKSKMVIQHLPIPEELHPADSLGEKFMQVLVDWLRREGIRPATPKALIAVDRGTQGFLMIEGTHGHVHTATITCSTDGPDEIGEAHVWFPRPDRLPGRLLHCLDLSEVMGVIDTAPQKLKSIDDSLLASARVGDHSVSSDDSAESPVDETPTSSMEKIEGLLRTLAQRWIPRTGMFVVVDHGSEPWVIVDYDTYDGVFYLEKADSARRHRDCEGRGAVGFGRTTRNSDHSQGGISRFAQTRVSPFYLEG